MRDSLCRVAVHHDGRTVELALPNTVDLADLLPSIVDIVHADGETGPGRWELHRCGGLALDDSRTLQENQIRDGELLWLTTVDPPPFRWLEYDAGQIVADNAVRGTRLRHVSLGVALTVSMAGAVALVHSARLAPDMWQWMVGAGLSVTAIAGAVTTDRTRHTPQLVICCAVIAVMFAAIAGAIAVPAGPLAAHLLLASAAAFSVSVLLLRLIDCGTTVLTGLATVTLLTAVASLTGVTTGLALDAAGAMLTTLSFTALGAAPRIAISLSRIGPNSSSGHVDGVRAAQAHSIVTGLLSGSSAAASIGVLLVVHGQADGRCPPLLAAAFATVTGIALTLRTRSHVDPMRQSALAVAGTVCLLAAFTTLVLAAPHAAHWLSLLTAAAAVVALLPFLDVPVGPTTRRAAEIAEYVMLAAVVPVGCWVAGVYALVRDAALT